jgi:hypothetical protein
MTVLWDIAPCSLVKCHMALQSRTLSSYLQFIVFDHAVASCEVYVHHQLLSSFFLIASLSYCLHLRVLIILRKTILCNTLTPNCIESLCLKVRDFI